jgi:hypothetical protein
MPVHQDLTVAYHQQDTDYYCGAACAQMTLDSIGTGLLDQDDLYADNHSHSIIEPNWYTGPDGLEWTMNDRRPPGFTNRFVLYAPTSEDTVSRKICWTIHHYKVAPIALVYGWAHWIVVRGFDASDAPSSSGDTAYTITAFYVNNPWPPCPSAYDPALAPPPPHSGTDGCGTGGNRGIADEHVAYGMWQSTYMTGVPSGHWAGKFLAVCDPEPPAARPLQVGPLPKRLGGERVMTPTTAARRAVSGIKAFGLPKMKHWKRALGDASPGKAVLVQRLDRVGESYYIVPMQSGRRQQIRAMTAVDARFGSYLQSTLQSQQITLMAPKLESAFLKERIYDHRFELPENAGRIRVLPELATLHSTLVWKPCRESLSPFWPFHVISHGKYSLYVRVDGEVFTELHDDERGI